jgi:copper(I)-binding protein
VRLQNRRVLGAAALALGAALVLAGCGAGQITQTATQQAAVNGTHAQVKDIALRDAAVQYPTSGPGYPAGATPALTLTIVNLGTRDDSLVSVTTEAGQATIAGSKDVVAAHSLVIGPDDAVESTNEVQTTSPSAPTSSSGAPTSTSAPTGTSSGTNTPGSLTASPTSEVPSSGAAATPTVPEKVGQGTVTLPALKQPLWPGQVIKVTFVFQNAGPVTVELPVAAPAHVKE